MKSADMMLKGDANGGSLDFQIRDGQLWRRMQLFQNPKVGMYLHVYIICFQVYIYIYMQLPESESRYVFAYIYLICIQVYIYMFLKYIYIYTKDRSQT